MCPRVKQDGKLGADRMEGMGKVVFQMVRDCRAFEDKVNWVLNIGTSKISSRKVKTLNIKQ